MSSAPAAVTRVATRTPSFFTLDAKEEEEEEKDLATIERLVHGGRRLPDAEGMRERSELAEELSLLVEATDNPPLATLDRAVIMVYFLSPASFQRANRCGDGKHKFVELNTATESFMQLS